MPLIQFVADNWQRALPALAALGAAAWLAAFTGDPTSERAIFAALLVLYMLHQTEEHLWPGGFRQFTNLLNEGKRLAKIAKPEAPLDVVSLIR